MNTVAILKTNKGQIARVFAEEIEARRICDKMNADPFIEPGSPDIDAPYSVDLWSVS